jgi:hypothetical protein
VEQLAPEGLQVFNALAQRYGFSQEALIQMMFAMLRGRGTMAGFNHPEFVGSGQRTRASSLPMNSPQKSTTTCRHKTEKPDSPVYQGDNPLCRIQSTPFQLLSTGITLKGLSP